MENIEERIREADEKIELINDFIVLSLRRKKISVHIEYLSEELEKLKNLMEKAQDLLQNEYIEVEKEYENVMVRLKEKHVIVLDHVIKEKRKKIKEAQEDQNKIKAVINSATKPSRAELIPYSASKTLSYAMERLQLNQSNALTPKITINDYKQSPMIKRSVRLNPIPFVFLEFDVQITPKQFEKIPKYIRGRETLDELNNFLYTIIVPCFNEKYKLIHRQRNTLRHADLDLWKLFNDQASYLPGKNFITAGDVSRQLNKILDKKTLNRLCMLRNIGVIQEKRLAQTVCYLWNA